MGMADFSLPLLNHQVNRAVVMAIMLMWMRVIEIDLRAFVLVTMIHPRTMNMRVLMRFDNSLTMAAV